MNESTQTSISTTHRDARRADTISLRDPVSIRVSPNSYLVALILGTFFAAFLFYLEFDLVGFLLFFVSWVCIPFFALNDRIVFDGKRIERSGLIPRAWSWFNGSRRRLKLTDIEQVETQAIRALKRGGNVYYRYRTSVRGKDLHIAFA